jgi:hypothetical protein
MVRVLKYITHSTSTVCCAIVVFPLRKWASERMAGLSDAKIIIQPEYSWCHRVTPATIPIPNTVTDCCGAALRSL